MEQEQEEQICLGGPGQLKLGSGSVWILAALTVGLSWVWACSRDAPGENGAPGVQVQLAWAASTEDGLRILAEPLFAPEAAPVEGFREETMLRRRLGLQGRLLRLHLIGEGDQLLNPGELRYGQSGRFLPLGEPPADLGPRDRLLWVGVGRSGTAEGSDSPIPSPALQRRSFLMTEKEKGEGELPEIILRWSAADREVALQAHQWTPKERRQFLEPDFASDSSTAGAEENGAPMNPHD